MKNGLMPRPKPHELICASCARRMPELPFCWTPQLGRLCLDCYRLDLAEPLQGNLFGDAL